MIQKALHIIIAGVVLLSSSGLVVQKHYCKDELKSVAVYVKAVACHNEVADTPPCPFHPHKTPSGGIQKKDCCNNTVELIKLEEEFQTETFPLDFSNELLLLSLLENTPKTYEAEEDLPHVHYLNFKPPLLVCNHTVRFQTFLC